MPEKLQENKNKRSGCLWLLLVAMVFIFVVYGIMIACMTMQDPNSARINSLKQVRSCEEKSAGTNDQIRNYFDAEACTELVKQHDARFKSKE